MWYGCICVLLFMKWGLWNDALAEVSPECLNDLPSSSLVVVLQQRSGFAELKAVTNFSVAFFILAGNFIRGNGCSLNNWVCPVYFFLYRQSQYRDRHGVLYNKETIELVRRGSTNHLCFWFCCLPVVPLVYQSNQACIWKGGHLETADHMISGKCM